MNTLQVYNKEKSATWRLSPFRGCQLYIRIIYSEFVVKISACFFLFLYLNTISLQEVSTHESLQITLLYL